MLILCSGGHNAIRGPLDKPHRLSLSRLLSLLYSRAEMHAPLACNRLVRGCGMALFSLQRDTHAAFLILIRCIPKVYTQLLRLMTFQGRIIWQYDIGVARVLEWNIIILIFTRDTYGNRFYTNRQRYMWLAVIVVEGEAFERLFIACLTCFVLTENFNCRCIRLSIYRYIDIIDGFE